MTKSSHDCRFSARITAWIAVNTLCWSICTVAVANAQSVAPDPSGIGPFAVTSAEYKFPAAVDPDVLDATPPRAVEIWARVYRPVDLSGGRFPLLVFFHGNHGTCGFGVDPRIDDRADYTTTGTCPDGYVVTPNHLGYGYVASRLASWGYIVVSINANRGITAGAGVVGDAGLNLARGRLLLRHLQHLSEWNTNGGTPDSLGVDLRGKLDFSSVGLLGHSRGGEGVRAAYNFYRDPGSPWPARIPDRVTFQGIFEIGAVDGQTSRVLNADGTKWNQLLPMCDGDVSNLQGVKPFDRMLRIFNENPTPKSTFTVWGANHDFYNTEWQVSDSAGCFFHQALFGFVNGSETQRMTGLVPVMAFFRGNVGPSADPTFNENFDPLFELPSVITDITRVDRGYTPSPNAGVTTVFEDFDRPTGINTHGVPNDASIILITHTTVPNHDPVQMAGAISWDTPGDDVYFQSNWTAAGTGSDITGFQTLDFRVSRQQNPELNPDPNTPSDFSIQLSLADGTSSAPVQLSTYADLRGPVGGAFVGNLHPILQTVRIPLGDFGDVDLTQVRGIRVTFNVTGTGAIYLANLRLSTVVEPPSGSPAPLMTIRASNGGTASGQTGAAAATARGNAVAASHSGTIVAIRSAAAAGALANAPGIEIEVASDDKFPVVNELWTLRIGDATFVLSRYADGDTNRLIFTLTSDEWDSTANGDPVSVQAGRETASDVWNLGALDKTLLK